MHLANKKTVALFSGLVLLPLFLIIIYLFVLAQDRYESNSAVVVKQVGEISGGSASGIGALLGVNTTSTEDIRYLQTYIQSPDIVALLDEKINLRKMFQGNGSDPFYQLDEDASREELVEYYLRHVHVAFDEKNMVLNISAQGFSSADALVLNRSILEAGDKFINDVSQRVAKEQLVFSTNQLKEATENVTRAREALIDYQNKNQLFDPQNNALGISKLVMSLQGQLADLQTQETTLLSYLNPNAPQVVALRSQIDAVKQQIAQESKQLTSPSGGEKLNRRAAEFEELKAKVEFATDLYKISLGSFEKSRLEAVRKLKNVVVITSPQLAQDALYPRKSYMITTSIFLLIIMFGIVQLIIAVVKEHKE